MFLVLKKIVGYVFIFIPLLSISCSTKINNNSLQKGWIIDFIDEFNYFNKDNWQDQLLWVNNEDQCYVRDGAYNTREISNGSLKLRLIGLDHETECSDNISKFGDIHPPTRYVSSRLASKNLKEFTGGKWTARIKFNKVGENGMFPAWWLLGARNNEPTR